MTAGGVEDKVAVGLHREDEVPARRDEAFSAVQFLAPRELRGFRGGLRGTRQERPAYRQDKRKKGRGDRAHQ
ncbi:hypothetical protein GCM10010488_35940 [Oerskovia jenensis]